MIHTGLLYKRLEAGSAMLSLQIWAAKHGVEHFVDGYLERDRVPVARDTDFGQPRRLGTRRPTHDNRP